MQFGLYERQCRFRKAISALFEVTKGAIHGIATLMTLLTPTNVTERIAVTLSHPLVIELCSVILSFIF